MMNSSKFLFQFNKQRQEISMNYSYLLLNMRITSILFTPRNNPIVFRITTSLLRIIQPCQNHLCLSNFGGGIQFAFVECMNLYIFKHFLPCCEFRDDMTRSHIVHNIYPIHHIAYIHKPVFTKIFISDRYSRKQGQNTTIKN